MATTQDNMKDDEQQFAAAFNEEDTPAVEQSEDEAFGLGEDKAEVPESPAEAAGAENESEGANEGDSPAVAIVIDGGDMEEAAEQAGAKDSAESAANQNTQVAVADEAEKPTVDMDKEVQRLKSWEGRLKAMEAKLKAGGADTEEEQTEAVAEAIEKAADATDSPADEEKVEQIADQVEEGSITPEQAMKQLAEDFGDDFVRMIEAIATAKAKEAGGAAASEKFGELSKTVDDIIGDIVDTKAKTHFETIADAHPDFNEIGASEQFKQYVESLPEGDKEQAMEVIGNGSAKQIIKLLNSFKAANGPEQADDAQGGDIEMAAAQGESIVDEATEEQMDAAEGVRSTGMKLPEQPAAKEGYADAWNEF